MGLFDRIKTRRRLQRTAEEDIGAVALSAARLRDTIPVVEKPVKPKRRSRSSVDHPKVIVINDCSVCPNRDHSGGFTPGGAKQICSHSHTINDQGPDWNKRIIPNYPAIPFWCPLQSVSELVKNEIGQLVPSVHSGE